MLFRAVERRRNPRLRRSDITVTDQAALKRATGAAALGNAMEWYDFGIYSYLVATLGKVFFPSGNDTVQLLAPSPPSPSPSWCARSAAWSSARSATGSAVSASCP